MEVCECCHKYHEDFAELWRLTTLAQQNRSILLEHTAHEARGYAKALGLTIESRIDFESTKYKELNYTRETFEPQVYQLSDASYIMIDLVKGVSVLSYEEVVRHASNS